MSARAAQISGDSVLGSPAGQLVSVRITVEPRSLERLLDALAHVPFPINPRLYHQAPLVRVFSDGRHESHAATLVEFPAWEARIGDVEQTLQIFGLGYVPVHVRSMLDEISALPSEVLEMPAN